jgi:hypothetical protein
VLLSKRHLYRVEEKSFDSRCECDDMTLLITAPQLCLITTEMLYST